jgi:hypothetical protein
MVAGNPRTRQSGALAREPGPRQWLGDSSARKALFAASGIPAFETLILPKRMTYVMSRIRFNLVGALRKDRLAALETPAATAGSRVRVRQVDRKPQRRRGRLAS